MRRVLGFLILASVIVLGAWALARLDGFITVTMGPHVAEIPLGIGALGLALGFVALYLLFRILGWIWRTPRRWRRWRAERDRIAGDYAVSRALVSLAANDAASARRESAQARKLLGDTAQTLLLTAEAARLANDTKGEAAAFHALTHRTDAAFLGWRGLLRAAAARQDWEEAARLAREADAAHPGAAWLKTERAALAVRTGAWKDALKLSGPDAPRAAFALAAARAETDRDTQLRLLRQANETDPTLTPAAVALAERLRADGRGSRADELLRRSWRAAPHPDIAAALLAPIDDRLERVRVAERLVKDNANHPESRLLLAQVSLDAGLTGEARRHLEDAKAAGVNWRRLWTLLADVEEAERGDTEAGRAAQRDALRAAAVAEADPAWRCGHCGTIHPAWAPLCGNCGTAGRIAWSVSPGRGLVDQLTATAA